MSIREMIEKREEMFLSAYACRASQSKGRKIKEEECDLRTCFQRDRDRIIHSKSFRRLKHKTQVFISPTGDHYRTRLTHTLEVSQIARTLARALSLNEDLVESMALGHDLGHTPFGHIGEDVLNKINPKGFKHYQQSVRVVEVLESRNGKRGLNLSLEVIDGILNHSGENKAQTLEGRLIKYADRIAYINHDIDDAVRAGVIASSDIDLDIRNVLGESHGQRIDTMVKDLVENSLGKEDLVMSKRVNKATMDLRAFMFERVYLEKNVKKEASKAFYIIEEVYKFYLNHIDKLPENHLKIYKDLDTDKDQIVTDYIAGMTDDYLVYMFNEIFIPKSWGR